MNRADLIGRLGRDPEVRTTQSGSRVVTFSMATSERWTDRNTGEKRERTQWHNIVIFNEPLGKIAEQYARKGHQLRISGQIETREYTDRDGQQRKTTEIVLRQFNGELELLEGKRPDPPGEDDYGQTRNRMPAPSQAPAHSPPARNELDDDIPF